MFDQGQLALVHFLWDATGICVHLRNLRISQVNEPELPESPI